MSSDWEHRTHAPDLFDQTHIWAVPLRQTPGYLTVLHDWLSTREQIKAQRLRVKLKQSHQIQARAWLRWLLGSYLNLTPGQVEYRYGKQGKPYLDHPQQKLYFNATDSGDILLCAFSLNTELGIDVELFPRKVNHQQIAVKKFTHKEQALINAMPQSQQLAAFLAIWTRKEAYGKALGTGIRYPMHQIQLCDNFYTYRQRVLDQHHSRWNLVQFNYKNYIACLVSRQDQERLRFYTLNTDLVSVA